MFPNIRYQTDPHLSISANVCYSFINCPWSFVNSFQRSDSKATFRILSNLAWRLDWSLGNLPVIWNQKRTVFSTEEKHSATARCQKSIGQSEPPANQPSNHPTNHCHLCLFHHDDEALSKGDWFYRSMCLMPYALRLCTEQRKHTRAFFSKQGHMQYTEKYISHGAPGYWTLLTWIARIGADLLKMLTFANKKMNELLILWTFCGYFSWI